MFRWSRRACLAALGTTLCLPLATPARAQDRLIPVQAGITLDRDTVTVGDVVLLSVRVRAPRGATINFPAAVDSLGPVQSLEPPAVRNGADTATAADRIATYRMAAWDVGRQPIKLGDILVQTDDGERRVALTLPELFVRSVLPADTAKRIPKPARPLLAAPVPTPWWWWAIAAVLALATALGAWWWARRRTRDAARVRDPYAEATAAFDRIQKLELLDAGEPGRYAALMTDVVRRYLSERLESASLAQTSQELLAAVRSAPSVPHDSLRQLLESVDPVKFAAAPLAADRAKDLGAEATMIVREEHQRAAALATAAGEGEARAA